MTTFSNTIATGGSFSAFGLTAEEAIRELAVVRPSRIAAKRQAHRESHMYRQGSGWIVSTWDDAYGCSVTSGELPYTSAKKRLADWRKRRAEYRP